MKKVLLLLLFVLCVISIDALSLDPIQDPDENIPVLLNVGNNFQSLKMTELPLGIRIGDTDSNMSNKVWLGQFEAAAIATNATASVFRYDVPSVKKGWLLDTSNFGFDTNAPIAVNGLWSTSDLATPYSVSVDSFRLPGAVSSAGKESQVCIDKTGSTIILCPQPLASEEISLNVVQKATSSTGTRFQIDWSSEGFLVCHALEGSGFFTGGVVTGTDISNPIDSSEATFMIACTTASGKMMVQTKVVDVQ